MRKKTKLFITILLVLLFFVLIPILVSCQINSTTAIREQLKKLEFYPNAKIDVGEEKDTLSSFIFRQTDENNRLNNLIAIERVYLNQAQKDYVAGGRDQFPNIIEKFREEFKKQANKTIKPEYFIQYLPYIEFNPFLNNVHIQYDGTIQGYMFYLEPEEINYTLNNEKNNKSRVHYFKIKDSQKVSQEVLNILGKPGIGSENNIKDEKNSGLGMFYRVFQEFKEKNGFKNFYDKFEEINIDEFIKGSVTAYIEDIEIRNEIKYVGPFEYKNHKVNKKDKKQAKKNEFYYVNEITETEGSNNFDEIATIPTNGYKYINNGVNNLRIINLDNNQNAYLNYISTFTFNTDLYFNDYSSIEE